MREDIRIDAGGAGVVFAEKRPYCRAVNGGAPPRQMTPGGP
jgi:hypothetical protein